MESRSSTDERAQKPRAKMSDADVKAILSQVKIAIGQLKAEAISSRKETANLTASVNALAENMGLLRDTLREQNGNMAQLIYDLSQAIKKAA